MLRRARSEVGAAVVTTTMRIGENGKKEEIGAGTPGGTIWTGALAVHRDTTSTDTAATPDAAMAVREPLVALTPGTGTGVKTGVEALGTATEAPYSGLVLSALIWAENEKYGMLVEVNSTHHHL